MKDDLMNALVRLQWECKKHAKCSECLLDTWCELRENIPDRWDLQSLREEWFGGDEK